MMLYSSMKYGSCAPIWLEIRKSSTARGRFLKTSTYTVAAAEASLLVESLVTPTITPSTVHRNMLTRVTRAELIIPAFRKTQRESRFGSASIGHGFILNVFTFSMKSNLTSHLLSMVALVPSFCRNMSRSSR